LGLQTARVDNGPPQEKLDLAVDAAQLVGRPAFESFVDPLVNAEREALSLTSHDDPQ